jgi:hypothetical protein
VNNTDGFGDLEGARHKRHHHKRRHHGKPPGFGDLEGIWGTLKRGATSLAKSAIPRLPGFPMIHKGFHLGRKPGAHGNTGAGGAGMPGRDPPVGGFRRGGKNFRGKPPVAATYLKHLGLGNVHSRKHLGFAPRVRPISFGDDLSGPYTSTETNFGGALDDVVSGASAVLDVANAKAEKLQNALYLIIGLSSVAAITGAVTVFRRR